MGPVYVWVWLPGAEDPVVAGRLDRRDAAILFTYGARYRARPGAIALGPDLPLRDDPIVPVAGEIAGTIADAAPDAWGRRIILNRRLGTSALDTGDLGILDYLMESGSDRIGALDFQASPTDYVPRTAGAAPLDELARSAEMVEAGVPLSDALAAALLHGTSVGGARPKAVLVAGPVSGAIAKFSSATDLYPVVQAEFVAMELARRAGLDVARVSLTTALGKKVLLIDRFDRPPGGGRRAMVSALTVLGLDEWGARYASYADLATRVRHGFADPVPTLRELFARITFNILVGNTDDHARNHAAFWDGRLPTLTPAYDVCPQPRGGGEATQAMAIGEDGWRFSQVAGCVARSGTYRLTTAQAREIVDHQIAVIRREWDEVCDRAELTARERAGFWGRQFLNPYALEGH